MRRAARGVPYCLLALAALVVALAASGGAAAATPCWKQVIDDWTDNKTIDKKYDAACYDKAIAKLPTDLRYYSDAPDTIEAAKEDMLRSDRTLQSHRPSESSSSGNSDRTGSSGSSKGDGGGPAGAVLNWGPSAAGDVPLPLLVIAFLALLLMAAGAASLINRRLHERRAGGPPGGPGAA